MEALSKSAVAEATRAATRSRAAFELKGGVTPLTVMRLRTTDLNLIERQLRAKLLQMPHFFQDAPVILDLGELEGRLQELPLPALVHVLRSMRVVPVGANGTSDQARELIKSASLPLLQTGAGKGRDEAQAPPAAPAAAERPAPVARAAARPELPAPRPDVHRP